jgi:hypothetical protein
LISLEGGTFTTSQISFQRFGSAGANFQWTSGTLHVGDFQGHLVNSAGILSPGSSIGATEIQGNYNQLTNGTLDIEIGPLGQGAQNDQVTVTGTATLDGQLSLGLINGAAPLSSQTFIILDASTLIGSFDNIASGQRHATIDGLGSFLVNYGTGSEFDPTQIVLSSFDSAGIPGDYNNDGIVNAAAYVTWRDHLGAPACLPNDSTPGVAIGDYGVWKQNFGATLGSGASAAVPEPASLFLLWMGLVAAASRLRRRRIL